MELREEHRLVRVVQRETETEFAPYRLSIVQKKILVFLSAMEVSPEKTGPDWISYIHEKFPDADVSQWISLLQIQWFVKTDPKNPDCDLFKINKAKVQYFLKALRYETNIRGVL
jgi:hypothetical protein